DFCEGDGLVVQSITEDPFPLDLVGGQLGEQYAWSGEGLTIAGEIQSATTALRSAEPVFERLDACRDNDAVTVEAWVTPASPVLGDAPGIVVLGGTAQNDSWDFGLLQGRRSEWVSEGYSAWIGTEDGQHELWMDEEVLLRLTHLVLVRSGTTTTLYIDGEVALEAEHPGSLEEGWSRNNVLALAAHSGWDQRNWNGTLHLVAIYCEALTLEQVGENLAAGHRPEPR
ncbi:MAG: LamG domain-containing protein, partial [Myxococcota bacterium]